MDIYNLTEEEKLRADALGVSTDPEYYINLFKERFDKARANGPIPEVGTKDIDKWDVYRRLGREDKKNPSSPEVKAEAPKRDMKRWNLDHWKENLDEIEEMVTGLLDKPELIQDMPLTIDKLMLTRFDLSNYVAYFLQPSIEAFWSQEHLEGEGPERIFEQQRYEKDFFEMEETIKRATYLMNGLSQIIELKAEKVKRRRGKPLSN